VGTFASGAAPEPGDHVIPHASIVLPCFNEEDHVLLEIERICGAMHQSGISHELLAIDDRYVLQVLRMVMHFDPLNVLMPPALFLFALGFGKGIYDIVVHPLQFANDTILIFVTGMILASMALLADLTVRSRADP
jgi:hypothetical protein